MTKNPVTLYKGEDEVLDFAVDMSLEFEPETDSFSSVAWSFSGPTSDLAIQSQSFTSSVATVWLSGGLHGARYQIIALMHTTGGRIYDRYFNLVIA